MPRNLDHRVELLFPVQDPHLKLALRDQILGVHQRDNVKARRLLPDASYERVRPKDGEARLDSRSWLTQNRGIWHKEE